MRRLLLAWLLVAAGQAHAQNTIMHYEYWFDRNGDNASRTLVAVSPPASVIDLLNESPGASALPVGPHRIHYRMRDARGRWSSVLHRDFRRLPNTPHHIVRMEYWFGQNRASRDSLDFTPASPLDATVNINVANVPVGPHRIHYRLKDNHGQWSGVLHRDFRRLPDTPRRIVRMEYWFDQDRASRDSLDLTPASPLDATVNINVANVPVGPHRIHYRLKDNHGQWSSVLHRDFRRNHDALHEVVMLRYWVDRTANPSMTEVPIPQPAQHIDIRLDLEHCMHTLGNTTVFYQLKDNHGQWSSVVISQPVNPINIDMVGVPGTPVITGEQAVRCDSIYTYSAYGPGGTRYTWTFPTLWNRIDSTNTTMTVRTPSTVASGQIIVVAHNSCGESAPGTINVVRNCADGLSDGHPANAITLFPNPTTGQFTLELDAPAQVAMFDAAGKQVVALQQVNGTRHAFDLGHANAGLYTVRIVQDGRVVNRRLIVQH